MTTKNNKVTQKNLKISKYPTNVLLFPVKGGGRKNKPEDGTKGQQQHPIDRRLDELGKSRRWLAEQVQRTPQCIGNYCNRKKVIRPDSLLTLRICKVLAVDLNYLILGRSHFQAQDFSQNVTKKNGIQLKGNS